MLQFSLWDILSNLLIATQWTNNLDFSRDFNVGLAGPLNTAFGLLNPGTTVSPDQMTAALAQANRGVIDAVNKTTDAVKTTPGAPVVITDSSVAAARAAIR